MREVKPCPFCGGEATIRYLEEDICDGNEPYGFCVECRACLVATPYRDNAEDAVAFWNRRPEEPKE